MYTTTNSIPDHVPMLAYCHVGSIMSRFSMIETRRATAARQPLSTGRVSVSILGQVTSILGHLQSSQTEQTHDKHLLSLLHSKSPHLDGRKHNHRHVLYNAHYCAHTAGIGFSDAIPRLYIFVPGVFHRAAGKNGKKLQGKTGSGDEANDHPRSGLEALGRKDTKVKQNDGYFDQSHEDRKNTRRQEQGLENYKYLPVLEIPHVLTQTTIGHCDGGSAQSMLPKWGWGVQPTVN